MAIDKITRTFRLKAGTVGAFVFIGMIIMMSGCESHPNRGDIVTIADIPSRASPYYAAVIVLDSTSGFLCGVSGIKSVGDNTNLVFEIKDTNGKPWTGKNNKYEVHLELYSATEIVRRKPLKLYSELGNKIGRIIKKPFFTTNSDSNKNYEENCIWKEIVLPLQTESISFYKTNNQINAPADFCY
jgi:hypothetical protein